MMTERGVAPRAYVPANVLRGLLIRWTWSDHRERTRSPMLVERIRGLVCATSRASVRPCVPRCTDAGDEPDREPHEQVRASPPPPPSPSFSASRPPLSLPPTSLSPPPPSPPPSAVPPSPPSPPASLPASLPPSPPSPSALPSPPPALAIALATAGLAARALARALATARAAAARTDHAYASSWPPSPPRVSQRAL